jgi:hypothetical protein
MNTVRRWCGLAVLAGLACGCVERRMTIVTDPPGAQVLVNRRPIGASAAVAGVDAPTLDFIYYGEYEFLLIRDGFEPLLVRERIDPPWYEWPLIDFFSENLVPWHIKDHRTFRYTLQPHRVVPNEDLERNAGAFRTRGQAIQATPPLPPPAGGPVPPPGLMPPGMVPPAGGPPAEMLPAPAVAPPPSPPPAGN